MRITFVNYHAQSGGASVAANRVASALEAAGVGVDQVSVKGEAPRSLVLPSPIRNRIVRSRKLESLILRLAGIQGSPDRSFNLLRTGIGRWLNAQPGDAVHLHWVARGMLSWQDLAEIGKPVVWTFHDGWAIGDSRYYPFQEMDTISRPSRASALLKFFSAKFAKRRQTALSCTNVQVVSPSEWLAKEADQSGLFQKGAVAIGNCLDQHWLNPPESFIPSEPRQRIWCLGASAVDADRRKGWHVFAEALKCMLKANTLPKGVEVHLFGVESDANVLLPLPVKIHGRLTEKAVRKLLTGSDLFVCPSILDNYPNIIAEAQACGCPVIGLPVGGVAEMVAEGESGWVANEATAESLAELLGRWVPTDGREGVAAFAHRRYSPESCAARHLELYQGLSW